MIAKYRLVLFVLFLAVLVNPVYALSPYQIELVSRASTNQQGDFPSYAPSVSDDGRYVVFESASTNLVAGDTNAKTDIFVRDRSTNTTTRVSVSSDGTQANKDSAEAAISGDGRYVVFQSDATNLVSGDTNTFTDIFVHDMQTGDTQRVSVSTGGTEANNPCYYPSISGDGQLVAFNSGATNLVTGDTNGDSDIFIHNLTASTTTRISVNNSGTQGDGTSSNPAISTDGKVVAFESAAINLATGANSGAFQIYIRNLQTSQTTLISQSTSGTVGNFGSGDASISADGRYVAFESDSNNLLGSGGDMNGVADIFVRDTTLSQTTRVSVSSSGMPTTSASRHPSISGDGRYVIFSSNANELIPGSTFNWVGIFVHKRSTGTTERVSVSNSGVEANLNSGVPTISGDGKYVVFESNGSNLVAGDTNGKSDIFAAWNIFQPAPDPANAAPERTLFTALPFNLTWTPLTWATGYEVQIDGSATFTTPIDLTVQVDGNNQPYTTVNTLPNGVYYWRVRAITATGTPGAWSAADSFELAIPE